MATFEALTASATHAPKLMAATIYDIPVRLMMPLMAKDLADPPGKVFTRNEVHAWFGARYPKVKAGTIEAHLARFSTNARGRLSHTVRPEEDLFFKLDSEHFRRYSPLTDPAPIQRANEASALAAQALDAQLAPVVTQPAQAVEDQDEVFQGPNEFAYESDLRDFLARNLGLIEPGLALYEDEEIKGVEFPVGGRYIDILAIDKTRTLVVIELKVSRGHERTVGQLLRYMGWIAKNQAEDGQKVRGIIAAREISDDLKLACAYLPNVSLFEYKLSVSLTPVYVDRLSAS